MTKRRPDIVSERAWRLSLHGCPVPGQFPHFLRIFRPIVQSGWVEVRSVGPRQRARLGIDLDAIEQVHIAQWAVEFTRQNRLKVDCLRRAIFKAHTEHVRGDDFE